MLYTDDDVITQADLSALDPEVPSVATAEQITVEGDGGIIRQAWDECADKILSKVQSFGDGSSFQNGQLTNDWGGNSSRVGLGQIVTTSAYHSRNSALHRWMTYRALVLFYRAASSRRGNDRYQEKRDQFEFDSREAWKNLFRSGLPVVWSPVPAPGSVHDASGTWDSANISAVVGGSQAGSISYDVTVTWANPSRQNAESGPAKTLSLTVPAGQVIRVDIASLVVPSGAMIDRIYQQIAPTGWNVYVGPAGGIMRLQNGSPVPVATTAYTLADAPTTDGAPVGNGQTSDTNVTMQATLFRG
jgi:hypothetical protein